jgi:hypothetical protein
MILYTKHSDQFTEHMLEGVSTYSHGPLSTCPMWLSIIAVVKTGHIQEVRQVHVQEPLICGNLGCRLGRT